MKPGQLPAVIGQCGHCALELYAAAPVHRYPDGQVAHIACHVDSERH